MARINYPEDFLKQCILFKEIKKRHDDDGADSVIIPFLTQKGIDLTADETATNEALAQHTLFEKTDKKGEDCTQDRDNLFHPVVKNMKHELQFLKKFYAGNVKELGNWGVQVDGNRIVYPPGFLKLAGLFKEVKKKHDKLGDESPLIPFLTQNKIDVDADEQNTAKAEARHVLKEQAKMDAEKYSEARDKLFDPVMAKLRLIGAYLKSLYVSNPKHLGNWGYTVDDSPRNPRFRIAGIATGGSRTLTGVKLKSEVENTGATALLLHKGKTVSPDPVALPAGMKHTIERGWGTMTVENENPTEKGEIGWLTTRRGN